MICHFGGLIAQHLARVAVHPAPDLFHVCRADVLKYGALGTSLALYISDDVTMLTAMNPMGVALYLDEDTAEVHPPPYTVLGSQPIFGTFPPAG